MSKTVTEPCPVCGNPMERLEGFIKYRCDDCERKGYSLANPPGWRDVEVKNSPLLMASVCNRCHMAYDWRSPSEAGNEKECPVCSKLPPEDKTNPSHYREHPSGVECITITEHMDFLTGNAMKYLWRAGKKNPEEEILDLEKALWYVQRRIDLLKRSQST